MNKIEFYKETNFKETSIGKIPKDWDIIRLGENFVEIETGKRAKGGALTEGTVASIGGEHIDDRGNVLWSDMKFIPEDFYESLNQGKVKLGDILLVKDGATTGKVALVRELNYEKVAVNEHVFIIRSKVDRLLNEFLYYFLFSKFGQIQIKIRFHGLIGGIVREDLEKVLIPYPPVVEQRAIAEVLSAVDLAIQRTDEVIAKNERLKKGLMQTLLTRGIGHKEFKDTEIGRIPKEWEVVKLGDVVEIHDSKRIPLSEMERSTRKGSYPYCGANGIIDYIDDYIFNGEFVLLAEDGGSYGKFENSAYIMRGKFWVNNHAHVLRAILDKTTNVFILFALNFLDLNPYIVGTTRKKLNQEQMKEIKIPLPPLPEQQKIAEILSTVDKKLELKKNEKAKLERIKKGLMDLLLTGKVRVKVN